MQRRSLGERGRLLLVVLLVAGAWLVVYAAFTRVFPDHRGGVSTYRYRDDALITLSHARGLVDVGTVSVGASGSRVEGYSTPLQFAAASTFYEVGGHGYRGFLDAQVAFSTAALGAAVFVVLRLAAPARRLTATVVVALGVAATLFSVYAFFGWHSSGMENALTNAMAAATVAALALALGPRPAWMLPVAGAVLALFALSRVEFVFHAAPLLVVASAYLVARGPGDEGWRRLALLVAPAAGIWLTVLAVRFWYFRDLAPNTAEAQGISPGDNLRDWADVLWPLLLPIGYVVVTAVRRRRLEPAAFALAPTFWLAAGGGLTSAFLLARAADARNDLPGIDALTDAARVLGLWWWLALVIGLAVAVAPRLGVVEGLLATLAGTGLCHVLVFGPARLAGERVVTFVLVPLACLAGALVLRLEPSRLLPPGSPRGMAIARVTGATALAVVAAGGAWSSHDVWGAHQPLCCDVSPTVERTLAEASSLEHRTELPVVSVANADLGLLSIQKQVNITDLGGLGDPLLTRVWRRGQESGRVDIAVDYLNHYATPDVVELHGIWSCGYAPWWTSEDFGARYEQVWDDGWTAAWGREGCPQVEDLQGGIWVRSDLQPTSAEVELGRRLADGPDPALVRRELDDCRSSVEWSCQYVTRSVYRNLRTFEDAGTLDETIAAFDRSPTPRYDQALLRSRSDGDWYEPAADSLFE